MLTTNLLKIQVKVFNQADFKTDLLIIIIPNRDSSLLKNIPIRFRKELKSILKKNILTEDENIVYTTLSHSSVFSVLFISIKNSSPVDPERFREAGHVIQKYMSKINGADAHLIFDDEVWEKKNFISAVIEGVLLSAYDTSEYKKKSKRKESGINKLCLLIQNSKQIKILRTQIKKTEKIINAVNFTRSMTNQPANILTPKTLAERVKRKFNSDPRVTTVILGKKQIEALKMNAFLSVAKGSSQRPVLLVINYRCGLKNAKKLALVGKGITFDSGGISIKPSHDMEKMKYDMAGAAAVIGIMVASSDLLPGIDIVAAAPAAENLPGSNAFRPGDIVKAYNGKTIEIINTDAEGRLLLADTLAYIEQKYKPDWLIDIATLTGSVANTFGEHCCAMFGNDSELKQLLTRSSETSGEKIWEMPVWDEYRKDLDSNIADLKHVGGRVAGGITAALFLKEFVNQTPWVHLDIAGTAYDVKSKKYLGAGASGFGVRLLLELIQMLEKQKQVKQ